MAEANVLARFLVERHFVPTKQLVKPRAFLPELYEGTLTTSVFDADDLLDEELWRIGLEHVANPESPCMAMPSSRWRPSWRRPCRCGRRNRRHVTAN